MEPPDIGDAQAAVATVYDRVAPSYDHFRRLWLHLAGAGAERAMLTDVAAFLGPASRARVLDAGCGTGALSRLLLAAHPGIELTMLDLSSAMLDRTADIPGTRLQGSLLELPFDDKAFDLVVSAWVVETVPDPHTAVSELLRVLADDGRLVYTFCSLPRTWLARTGSRPLRRRVGAQFAGAFLDDTATPWHDCAASHRQRFRGGLTTEIALGSCCTVGPAVLPAPSHRPGRACPP